MSSQPSNRVSASAEIDPSAILADRVRIGPFCYVGPNVTIGADTELGPNVTILQDTSIGNRVRIGPGTVIGVTGFGYTRSADRYELVPHQGRVVIEDDVEIGANCTIARARTDVTRIGTGTKIDSLVHIGHNVTIGQNCILVAQVGIAGSVRIGNNVILAGQVGVKDHVTIGDNSVVYAKSALYRSIPANSRYSGIPARPHPETLRVQAEFRRRARRD